LTPLKRRSHGTMVSSNRIDHSFDPLAARAGQQSFHGGTLLTVGCVAPLRARLSPSRLDGAPPPSGLPAYERSLIMRRHRCRSLSARPRAPQQYQQPPPSTALLAPRRKTSSKHQPHFDIRSPVQRLTGGADLSPIDSIGPQAALQIVAEIGTDMRRWPTEKHFSSWLALAPNNKVSGGRLLSSRTPPSANRAAVILRRCAMSLGRTSTALGAFFRRLAARVGKAKAITATARKLAVLVPAVGAHRPWTRRFAVIPEEGINLRLVGGASVRTRGRLSKPPVKQS
jgi:transposase IS116/IS110/IS902 family protein